MELIFIGMLTGGLLLPAADVAPAFDGLGVETALAASSMFEASVPGGGASPALAPLSLAAGEPATSASGLEGSFAIGVLLPGEITLEAGGDEIDVDSDAGFMLKTSLDYFPMKYLGVGVFFQAMFPDIENGGSFTMFELGPAVKGRYSIPVQEGMAFHITPGLGIGWRGISPENGDFINGMAVNFGVDLRLEWNKLQFSLEPGFITQPVGGEDGVDVTFAPIPYLLFGVGYAF